MPGEGFFAAPVKMPTGKQRTEQVGMGMDKLPLRRLVLIVSLQGLTAWKQGKEALNTYIGILNDGLMLELNQLKTI
jgi:hypothetical protein